MREVAAAQARRELSVLIDDVMRGDEVALTRFGRPVAVVVDPDWHKRAEDCLAAHPCPENGLSQ